MYGIFEGQRANKKRDNVFRQIYRQQAADI